MTANEVIEKLAGHKLKWRREHEEIRVASSDMVLDECCPLTALCYLEKGIDCEVEDYNLAAKALGVPEDVAITIVVAADFEEPQSINPRELRKVMYEMFEFVDEVDEAEGEDGE